MAKAKAVSVIKPAIHYTHEYLINPMHPVTINVIGCGGTGSQVLNSLARMHSALKALGHPGLFIRAVDPDKVTEANMGRQLFSPADIELSKAAVLIGRINRFFGTDWEAIPELYNLNSSCPTANITISCVDTGAARKEIKEVISVHYDENTRVPMGWGTRYATNYLQPYQRPYYWLDFGNMMDRGQAVLGTVRKIKQPNNSDYTCRDVLPTIDKIHREIFKDNKNDDQGPSCSLAEALQRQDLFINTNLANMGLGILWKLFREARIRYHGCYLNLDSMSVTAIKIK
jgi:PRTRC genetic system ThiF family protein